MLGNAGEILPKILERKITPDIITDQTSAHDTLNGYVPMGMSFDEALDLRKSNPNKYISLSKKQLLNMLKRCLNFKARGSVAFDYGNNIRGEAKENGLENAFDIPGIRPGIYSSSFL